LHVDLHHFKENRILKERLCRCVQTKDHKLKVFSMPPDVPITVTQRIQDPDSQLSNLSLRVGHEHHRIFTDSHTIFLHPEMAPTPGNGTRPTLERCWFESVYVLHEII
ncbi:hypothetical protein L915_03355, partial [Phytophthora nicotianae]